MKVAPTTPTSPTEYDIFISLRFLEAKTHGLALQQALERLGLTVFLCNVEPGGDIAAAVIAALTTCKLAVILGTETYGKNTGVGYSTVEELRYIIQEKKPFFLVKMCDQFTEPEARFRLPDSLAYYPWQPRSAAELPPADLVQKIADRLHHVRNPATAKVVAAAAVVQASTPAGMHTAGPALTHPSSVAPQSLSSWLAEHELQDLAAALAELEVETLKDAVYAAKKGLVTEEQLVARGVKRLRALRFLDSVVEQS